MLNWLQEFLNSGQGSGFEAWVERVCQRVNALTAERAREILAPFLEDPAKYAIARSGNGEWDIGRVGPVSRAFFGEFDEVRELFNDVEVSRALIGPSKLVSGYTVIGIGSDASEILIPDGGDEVFDTDVGPEYTHPTIYHYLLVSLVIVLSDEIAIPDDLRS